MPPEAPFRITDSTFESALEEGPPVVQYWAFATNVSEIKKLVTLILLIKSINLFVNKRKNNVKLMLSRGSVVTLSLVASLTKATTTATCL
jgi:hypothetical protein